MSARILVVHDQEDRRKQIRDCLCPMHKVTICDGIQGAIDAIKSETNRRSDDAPFDLILSCVHLDDARGALSVFDLLKWRRGNAQIREVPFVLLDLEPSSMAASVIDSIRDAGKALGSTGYIVIGQFDRLEFLNNVDSYLPAELRSSCLDSHRGHARK